MLAISVANGVKNKHYAEIRALIGRRDITGLNSSETDLKQIISLNKELTTTTLIVENSEQETEEALKMEICIARIDNHVVLAFLPSHKFRSSFHGKILSMFVCLLGITSIIYAKCNCN
jgi:hypothetical protein